MHVSMGKSSNMQSRLFQRILKKKKYVYIYIFIFQLSSKDRQTQPLMLLNVLDCVYEFSFYTKHSRLSNMAIKMVSLYQTTYREN